MTAPDIDTTINSIFEQKKKHKEVLATLLDEQLGRKDSLFVQVTEMAGTPSYLAKMTFQHIALELKFAKDLGLFEKMFDLATGELIVDQETIDEIQQRPLNFTRQLPLTIYLAGRKHHKFPAILVVQTDDWVDDPTHENWEMGEDGQLRAKVDSVRFTRLDSNGEVGLLDLIGYLYALDGQHRLLGIKGLMELINDRRIVFKTKNGDPVKKDGALSLQTLAQDYGVNETRLNSLQNETLALEIIPAVKKGETRDEARRRVKSVFTHVNKSAVQLTPGQIAQLDEDDGFALVAKRAAVHHPLLKSTGTRAANPRVNWQNSTISNTSTVLTTLQTLTEMSEGFLVHEYRHWKSPFKDLVPVRPDDDELEAGEVLFNKVLDGLESLESMKELDRGKTARDFRLSRKDGGPAHLLFRPLGQIALARALGTLVIDQGRDLEEIFRMLRTYEGKNGFSIDDPANPWWGVVYDAAGQKIARGGESGAERVLLWLLGGMADAAARHDLLELLVDRRAVEYDAGGNATKVRNYDGSFIAPGDLRLPPMLT